VCVVGWVLVVLVLCFGSLEYWLWFAMFWFDIVFVVDCVYSDLFFGVQDYVDAVCGEVV
jgi:hypothetical protein